MHEPPTKRLKNLEYILRVPHNIESALPVIMATGEHKILCNALNDIIASITEESQE